MIVLEKISKSYINQGVEQEVLKQLSISFHAGEIISIVGTNGSGKTTLLRMIAGLLFPDSGYIKFNFPDSQKPFIGIVHQSYRDSLFPWRTVYRNIHLSFEYFNGLVFSEEEENKQIESIISRFDINDISKKRPWALSGGQAQLVAIARALVHPQMKVLLMDEPFSALDGRNLQKAAKEIIETTRKNGAVTIVITHDIDVGILLGDRIAVLTSESKGITKVIEAPFKGEYNPEFLVNKMFLECKKEVLGALYPAGVIK
ncbi:MAG: ABC transporter ATP-binding protein [Bacteroidales bacterium]|nr:ABC transporter ATP-binding protein [Bacteroidales bacterium]